MPNSHITLAQLESFKGNQKAKDAFLANHLGLSIEDMKITRRPADVGVQIEKASRLLLENDLLSYATVPVITAISARNWDAPHARVTRVQEVLQDRYSIAKQNKKTAYDLDVPYIMFLLYDVGIRPHENFYLARSLWPHFQPDATDWYQRRSIPHHLTPEAIELVGMYLAVASEDPEHANRTLLSSPTVPHAHYRDLLEEHLKSVHNVTLDESADHSLSMDSSAIRTWLARDLNLFERRRESEIPDIPYDGDNALYLFSGIPAIDGIIQPGRDGKPQLKVRNLANDLFRIVEKLNRTIGCQPDLRPEQHLIVYSSKEVDDLFHSDLIINPVHKKRYLELTTSP